MNDESARLWSVELVEHPFAETASAVRKLARSSKWPPSLAEVLEMVAPKVGMSASEAFAATMASVLPHRASERHKYIPAACMEAVRSLGGWSVIALWKRENMGIHQREFERVYSEGVELAEKRQAIGSGTPALDMLRGGE